MQADTPVKLITIHLPLPERVINNLEDFRASQRPIPSRLAAITHLIDVGLAALENREPDAA